MTGATISRGVLDVDPTTVASFCSAAGARGLEQFLVCAAARQLLFYRITVMREKQ